MKNNIVNILTGGGGPAEPVLYTGSELADDVKFNAKGGEPAGCAFTMAEILLSLTIIGVVAAITLPSLTGNINERTWNTQRKALYARFSQAIALMPALNGYGTVTEATESASAVDTAAETFVTEGLSKVLKINNICDSEHLADCGIPSHITTMTGNNNLELENITNFSAYNSFFSAYDTKAAAFETVNGESILTYYNPRCVSFNSVGNFELNQYVCANFVYDLNGNKGPNTMGKDIGFITVFYPTDAHVAAPLPVVRGSVVGGNTTLENGRRLCREDFDNARLPNREELMAMGANTPLLAPASVANGFQSSTVIDSERNWHVNLGGGNVYGFASSHGAIWCINR